MDFFIMLSSIVSFGNAGASNYSAGNSYQDALARHLASQGHNAISINIPIVDGVGILARDPRLRNYLGSGGWPFLGVDELIAALDFYAYPPADKKDIDPEMAQIMPRMWLPRYSAVDGAVQPTWQDEPKMSHLVLHGASDPTAAGKQGSGKSSASALLAAAKTLQDAEQVVLEALLDKLNKVLSVDEAELDPARPMNAYGVDSLVAVELRTWMKKEIGAEVSVFDLTGGQRISQLASKAAGISRFVTVEKPL
jgi:acyl carrier protein